MALCTIFLHNLRFKGGRNLSTSFESQVKTLSKTVPKSLILRKILYYCTILVEECAHHAVGIDTFDGGTARTGILQRILKVGLVVHCITIHLCDDEVDRNAGVHESTLTNLDNLQSSLDIESAHVVLADGLQH